VQDGWVNMNVKFMISRDSVQASKTIFGITIFPPGAKHDIHRHPHAEETEYVAEGHGIARVGDDHVAMGRATSSSCPRTTSTASTRPPRPCGPCLCGATAGPRRLLRSRSSPNRPPFRPGPSS
jgi:hypothetical protein